MSDNGMAAGLQHLSGLTRLKVLSLWNSLRVTDQGLAHLQALPIMELSLRGCLIDDSACPALARLRNLVRVDLRACERLTGSSQACNREWKGREALSMGWEK